MRLFGILVGAVLGAMGGMMAGKPIHDLIWSRDMEGASAYFTFLIVMPLFATVGATLLGGLLGRSSLRGTLAATVGALVGEGAGLLVAIYGFRPIGGPPFLLIPLLIVGGAVGGALGAARMVGAGVSPKQPNPKP